MGLTMHNDSGRAHKIDYNILSRAHISTHANAIFPVVLLNMAIQGGVGVHPLPFSLIEHTGPILGSGRQGNDQEQTQKQSQPAEGAGSSINFHHPGVLGVSQNPRGFRSSLAPKKCGSTRREVGTRHVLPGFEVDITRVEVPQNPCSRT